jgi:VWA domain-containing protein
VELSLLTPHAALVTLVVLVPLAAFLRVHRAGRRIRLTLALTEPRRRALLVPILGIVGIAALLGAAAAQPVVSTSESARVRSDAEVFFVLDTSRSMLASDGPTSPTRIARAKRAALQLREAIPTVPSGLASVTDRTLPHLFPTSDEDAFRSTLEESIGVERPPPLRSLLTRVTSLEALGAIVTNEFFRPSAEHRVLVVFTDGETLAGTRARLGPLFRRPPGVSTEFVQVWGRDERIYVKDAVEVGYRPDPTAREALDRIADGIDGQVLDEHELTRASHVLAGLVGKGPTVVEGRRRRDVPLAPPLAAAAFLPLALLLWRRDR